jgi:hypothetical protein
MQRKEEGKVLNGHKALCTVLTKFIVIPIRLL